MPLVTAARFPALFAQGSNRGLTEGITSAFGNVSNAIVGKAQIQAQQQKAYLDNRANGFLYLRNIEDPGKQRLAMLEMAATAYENDDPRANDFDDLVNTTDKDVLNLKLSQLAVLGGAKPQEKWNPVFGEGGTIVGQESSLTGEVKAHPGQVDKQQGTGVMSGYSFSPLTGGFTLSQEGQAAILADAKELTAKDGMLTPKEIAGVNDKVTGLTSDVADITNAAKSLHALRGRGTPAAQVAAVFKFMKALDPTSTVRDSELGLVYSAEGAAKGLANKLNALLGEGELSDTGFTDLVDTAATMANNAIDGANNVVSGYLNVLSDKMPSSDIDKMQARVPQKLDFTENKKLGDYTPAELDELTPDELRAIKNRELQLLGADQ